MSKRSTVEDYAKMKVGELEKEELRLFHSYNRHAQASVKLTILNQLIVVINQKEALKSILPS